MTSTVTNTSTECGEGILFSNCAGAFMRRNYSLTRKSGNKDGATRTQLPHGHGCLPTLESTNLRMWEQRLHGPRYRCSDHSGRYGSFWSNISWHAANCVRALMQIFRENRVFISAMQLTLEMMFWFDSLIHNRGPVPNTIYLLPFVSSYSGVTGLVLGATGAVMGQYTRLGMFEISTGGGNLTRKSEQIYCSKYAKIQPERIFMYLAKLSIFSRAMPEQVN